MVKNKSIKIKLKVQIKIFKMMNRVNKNKKTSNNQPPKARSV